VSESTPLRITFKRRGTILIEGVVEVRDEEGNVVPQPPAKQEGLVKFCGCGHSATKPFCDGSHKQFMGGGPKAAGGS
jgi:CDGSH-type Zn-finger protein